MSTYFCPKGHASTESDFCSECGAKILGISEAVSVTPVAMATQSASPLQSCPDCATPHDRANGDFCEICGYNFVTGAHGELPVATKPTLENATVKQGTLDDPSTTGVDPAIAPSTSATSQWQVEITVDPSLRHPDSPLPPEQAAIVLPLDQISHLIGRNSQLRAVHPEIALDFDDAVSHRHALLTLQPDGSLILRDIGSSNGTQLNGSEIKPMVDITVKEGDEITLGHWTRIRVMKK
jgi:pSer/pThr/pTyr-binding forkhead associated (FHA) protein